MSTVSRLVCSAVIGLAASCVAIAAEPKSPFGQAGDTAKSAQPAQGLEFTGISSIGDKRMVNLYDTEHKRSFWIELGATSGGITVVKYEADKDQITIRQNGAEKVLPLRAAAGIAHAAVPATPAMGPSAPAGATPTSTPTPTPISQLSPARQEEEARMLVSDLLEIGMAQRRAYEEAQKKAAGGQPAHAPATDPNAATAGTTTETAQPANTAAQPQQPTASSEAAPQPAQ